MTKITALVLAGFAVLLVIMLAFAAVGLAVREQKMDEIVVWLPPGTRYQMLLRIGADALPWGQSSNSQTAINMWVHGRGTQWHVIKLVHVPLGEQREQVEYRAP